MGSFRFQSIQVQINLGNLNAKNVKKLLHQLIGMLEKGLVANFAAKEQWTLKKQSRI